MDFMSRAEAQRDLLIAQRRDFHRNPELAFQEVRTAGIVANELNQLGLEVQTGVGKTGVVGILEGSSDGPTVLVRCDMDALPILEEVQADYTSANPGKMHACGHDGHTAIALSVARMFSEMRANVHGRIKFVFQPAEEIARGAQAMIDDGVLTGPTPDVAVGLHLWNDLPSGTVSITDEPAMAGADDWQLVIRGSGGHGASPHETRDPIVCGAQIVSAFQTIVSRNISGFDHGVVSVCVFQAGEARNVIPSEARLGGTFRTFTPEIHDRVVRRMTEISTGIATAMGCTAEFTYTQLTPPLLNDAATNTKLKEAFHRAAPGLTYVNNAKTMGAEDMAVFLQHVPGTYFFVGTGYDKSADVYPHHHPKFDIDENMLPVAAGLLATAVAEYVIK
jgi:amidohydrolase